jgi:hypothetical protein
LLSILAVASDAPISVKWLEVSSDARLEGRARSCGGWSSGFDDSVPAHEHIRPGAFGLLGHLVGLLIMIALAAKKGDRWRSALTESSRNRGTACPDQRVDRTRWKRLTRTFGSVTL